MEEYNSDLRTLLKSSGTSNNLGNKSKKKPTMVSSGFVGSSFARVGLVAVLASQIRVPKFPNAKDESQLQSDSGISGDINQVRYRQLCYYGGGALFDAPISTSSLVAQGEKL
jgi:hypothetical protein